MSDIRHEATIVRIENDSVFANVENKSACADCHARQTCALFDCRNKIIEIKTNYPEKYAPGQHITVTLDEKHGWIAVFYGYILPLVLVLVTLIATNTMTGDETASAIYSLMVLIPYYLVLFLFKKSFSGKFQFRIED